MRTALYFCSILKYAKSMRMKEGVKAEVLFDAKNDGYITLCFKDCVFHSSWHFTAKQPQLVVDARTALCSAKINDVDPLNVTIECPFKDMDKYTLFFSKCLTELVINRQNAKIKSKDRKFKKLVKNV